MLGTIIAGVVTYWSTAIDLLIILMLFFAKVKDKKGVRNIYIGQFLGSGLLILVSLFFAVILHYVPDKRLLGFLGIIPVFLGIKALILGDSDGEKMANEKLKDTNQNNLIKTLIFITIVSCGADNVGLFVPYFISLALPKLLITLIVFLIMIFLLVFIAQKSVSIPTVGTVLEKYSRWFIGIVYIFIGGSVLIENGSIQLFINLIK
ncbi:CadD family cadmium resistance transporter [Limosilactobacillus reuteri]|uniref:CadD family cadmium resistance transporter n=1 Tax=Limosilactobacillus reuteri TaxID=1598 RepID=A0AAW6JBK5_LIMRT|nr:CadD family cadmium resistance transporter [Limosilactobacillus reuteri]MCC4476828.1 CadD family cadmium resistance transporter [Limosilactobacillus reuteri]MCC4478933.1 CadD family cadmium resistance transporter [Limosilactobacillus reuteri]MCC4487956.1 CadD family cadmium resistance transporter [Limosilactobacillus reuteri]MCC4492282.1 CadD family cadmium resistance transporter [Limosilactobacillus reuteri]MCC4494344.1 CadD family cadmium resistance transporter [Limosilactobacillus reuter